MRVVLLTGFTANFQVLTSWAQRHGHEIVLVATEPPTTSVLVTSQLEKVAVPVIAAMAPTS
ncbi:hypothetical protein [Winogradskya humida]|uniref:Methionyl-tRNA formyltransferase n=1 Tax=Winogradskya humida TaxID=113566 RepID=A0ABQ3ZY56_9ACTN|nr:hypothetical protein [Actinoplanes humidus]GIE23518.1 hypothetical protein Ahu01nite_066200 [Actinoplanes humidus]